MPSSKSSPRVAIAHAGYTDVVRLRPGPNSAKRHALTRNGRNRKAGRWDASVSSSRARGGGGRRGRALPSGATLSLRSAAGRGADGGGAVLLARSGDGRAPRRW